MTDIKLLPVPGMTDVMDLVDDARALLNDMYNGMGIARITSEGIKRIAPEEFYLPPLEQK